ncbi:hypothetical protein GobsT_09460 [Gemmata obscuriglobus]|uniref:Uncharacterized protein n=1 Tax=Gemmata obscuriglobus TaxID=114 RepID=A0A2Z3HGM0_9BACT|nr:hypothetical protein [Gemmata obscuriglobus]AWM40540.1 hypothetical protein C1280_28530 [Gemmata obscuriglobus]QEG26207.1 hypothetical protein GobsT_09460 [Gemmata obscuriglobus]VTS00909.1 unnamed protein product [Gemmata obscuriglobus UQM 2246]
MKKLLLGPAVFCLLTTGCGGCLGKPSAGSYDLVVGAQTTTLPAYDDPVLIQNDILSHLKPLWDNLQSGESVTFYCTRNTLFQLGASGNEIESERRGAIPVTVTTPSFRFFKDRHGTNGLEQAEPDRPPSPMISGADLKWTVVEQYLRAGALSTQKVRELLQGGWGDPVNAPGGK